MWGLFWGNAWGLKGTAVVVMQLCGQEPLSCTLVVNCMWRDQQLSKAAEEAKIRAFPLFPSSLPKLGRSTTTQAEALCWQKLLSPNNSSDRHQHTHTHHALHL